MNEHNQFILRAIELSGHAVERGNEPFAAILVHKGKIVLEAENTVQSENDVTRHAGMNLVSHASRQISPSELRECTVYTSTEPCPMCAGAIYWAGISQVVYGSSNEALRQISGPSVHLGCRKVFDCCYQDIDVIGPLEEELACEPYLRFWPHPS